MKLNKYYDIKIKLRFKYWLLIRSILNPEAKKKSVIHLQETMIAR